MSIQKKIDAAIDYIDSLKSYTKGARIIDDLLKSFMEYENKNKIILSEYEMIICSNEYNQNEIHRLKKIIQLYGGDDSITIEQIKQLSDLKENTQYYTGLATWDILAKYNAIDLYLKKYNPKKETRPKTISQVNDGFKIILENYERNKN